MIAATTAPNMSSAGGPPASEGISTIQADLRLSARNRAPRAGFSSPSTSVFTIAVNAAPMTTATARSMTLPRMMNSLKPLSMSGTPYGGYEPEALVVLGAAAGAGVLGEDSAGFFAAA